MDFDKENAGNDAAEASPERASQSAAQRERAKKKAELAEIDHRMHQLKTVIISVIVAIFVLLLFMMVWYDTAPTYTVSNYTRTPQPTASVRPSSTPTARPSPSPRASSGSSSGSTAPYVGMYVSYVPKSWEWRGTDNLTVKDAAGNKVKTTLYYYEALPKSYTIWVDQNDRVVKVSTYDRSATPKPKNTSKPNASSDPYHASDYLHPDDFYYDYRDDFWDYEDAEDYWEAHQK